LILRRFDTVDLHHELGRAEREKNPRTLPAGRNLHDPRQVLVEAVHPQPVQVDTRRLGTELAAPLDDTHYL
jgi:hypothetical protein